jgi:hypothetical protein
LRPGAALQKLIDSTCDCEYRLRHESGFVDAPSRLTLRRLADDRGASTLQLREVFAGYRLIPSRGSWTERLRDTTRGLSVLAGGVNRGDAVAACRRAMARVEARYERALAMSWPDESRAVLLRQQGTLRNGQSELVAIQF